MTMNEQRIAIAKSVLTALIELNGQVCLRTGRMSNDEELCERAISIADTLLAKIEEKYGEQ